MKGVMWFRKKGELMVNLEFEIKFAAPAVEEIQVDLWACLDC